MAELVAIGYPDETTAAVAAQEAERLAKDLILQPDAIAVIVRDKSGKYHVTTNHNPVAFLKAIKPADLDKRCADDAYLNTRILYAHRRLNE